MNQHDSHKQIIYLASLPASVEGVLADFFGARYRINDMVSDMPPALIISGEDEETMSAYPAVPVLTLVAHGARPTLARLADLAADMMSSPALYLEPLHLRDTVLKPMQKILSRAGQDIALTDKETDILIHLARAGGAAVTREQLLRRVWGYGDGIDTHTLETHIYRLRQKTGDDLVMTNDQGYFIAR